MRILHFLLLTTILLLSHNAAFADADAGGDGDALVVSNYIAWWAHDDLGYHPAVAFLYQNESGDEVSDLIRFQARFVDIKNNYLSVTRNDIRPILQKGAQRHDVLMGNESYELSIDTKSWPQIECKILYKIGDESEAHQLLLARVEQVTMTGEEAVQRLLSQGTSRRVKSKQIKRKRKTDTPQDSASQQPADAPEAAAAAVEAPLSAGSALSLGSKAGNDNKNTARPTARPAVEKKAEPGWHFKNAAGIADDFFNFEQAYGRPTTYEASPNKWTWAKYQPPGDVELYAGARPGSSKADVVVAFVKSRKQVPETQLIGLGREFIGKYKSQLLGAPTRTVRYMPGGRVQMTTLASATFHFSIYATGDSPEDNRYYVVLSRVPASSDAMLLEQAKRSKLLRFMLPVMGEGVDAQP